MKTSAGQKIKNIPFIIRINLLDHRERREGWSRKIDWIMWLPGSVAIHDRQSPGVWLYSSLFVLDNPSAHGLFIY